MLSMLKTYSRDNQMIYLILFIILAIGLVSGAVASEVLSVEKIDVLTEYINNSVNNISNLSNPLTTIKTSIMNHSLFVFKIWFLGLIIIGAPIIFFMLFTHGFSLGFTVAFFLANQGWKGLGLVLISIFIPNLIYLPIIFFASAISICFNIYIFKKGTHSVMQLLFKYIFFMVFLLLCCCLVGSIEGFLSQYGAKLIL